MFSLVLLFVGLLEQLLDLNFTLGPKLHKDHLDKNSLTKDQNNNNNNNNNNKKYIYIYILFSFLVSIYKFHLYGRFYHLVGYLLSFLLLFLLISSTCMVGFTT